MQRYPRNFSPGRKVLSVRSSTMDSKKKGSASPKAKGDSAKGQKKEVSEVQKQEPAKTAKDAQYESQISCLQEALAASHSKVESLIAERQELEENAKRQERDSLDVISLLQDSVDEKSLEVSRLRELLKAKEEEKAKALELSHEQHRAAVAELVAQIHEREANLNVVQQEFSVLKDFRKKRNDLLHELDQQKVEMREMEQRHGEMLARMERRYFEEKMKLEELANSRVAELATKAHEEAVASIDSAAKDVFRENIRLAEALKVHMDQDQSLVRKNEDLVQAMQKLAEDNSLNEGIVKEQIKTTKHQTEVIRQLRAKISSLELVLSQVVEQFEQEQLTLKKVTKKRFDEISHASELLQSQLGAKVTEMACIKRLAQHILDQRTDLETFFTDALEQVRRGKLEQLQESARKDCLATHAERLQKLEKLGVKPLPLPKNAELAAKLLTLSSSDGSSEPSFQQVQSAVDLSSLSWEEKETVLRDMFARMNRGKSGAKS